MKKILTLLFALSLVLNVIATVGRAQTELVGSEWITAGDIQQGQSMPVFRKVLKLKETPRKAVLYATALGVYDVTINGQRVGQHELKPGWTDYRKEVTFQTLDVAPFLHKGDNEVSVQLSRGWWAGAISRGVYASLRQSSGQAGSARGGKHPQMMFRARLDVDGRCIAVTDNTWQYSLSGPLLEGDIYNGETYDARREIETSSPMGGGREGALRSAITIDSLNIAVIPFEGPEVRIRPERLWRKPQTITIYHDTINTGTTFGQIKVDRVLGNEPFTLHKGETAVVDLGQNMVGWMLFTAKAKAGTTLTLRHGEMLNQNGDREGRLEDGPGGSVWTYNLRSAASTVRYTFRGDAEGETYHPRYTFMGFRYVSLTATDDVELRRLTGQVVGSDIEEWGEFECSDSSINQLYNNVWWGQRGNFLSVPTDCPQRDERLGWTGDTQIFSRTALYQSDCAAFYRKWMRDMRNSQREDGAYPDIAPYNNFWGFGTAAWGDAGVIVPWNVYEMTGDKTILEENFESMTRWMQYLERVSTPSTSGESEGAIGGGTATGDWLAYDPLDARYVAVAYYAYVAQLMDSICQALDKPSEAASYRQLYQNIRREFQKRYLTSDGQLTKTTQTAYLLALRFGLLPEEYRDAARVSLRQKIEQNDYRLSTGFVGTALLCPVLSDEDMDDLAYALLLQRQNPSWLYSVDQGATTVWERWDSYTREGGFHKHPWNMNSFNHYAYGVIAEWMYAYMGGIRPASPGFSHVILAPHADRRPADHPSLQSQPRITWARTKIHTLHGDITSSWRLAPDGHYDYDFTLPHGITYDIKIPHFTEQDRVNVRRTPEVQTQRKTCIDRDWKFFLGDGSAALSDASVTDDWRTLDLPHDWSVETEAAQKAGGTVVGPFSTNSIGKYQTGHTVGGEGWYLKKLTIDNGQLITDNFSLYFEGAYNQTDVWLNGHHIYFNHYGYSSFRFDVTDKLREGENTLLVRVRNEGNNTRWYAGSGIYRHVWLIKTPKVHVDEWGTFIKFRDKSLEFRDGHADGEVAVETCVYNDGASAVDGAVSVDIIDAQGTTVATKQMACNVAPNNYQLLIVNCQLSGLHPWSPESPYLYKAVIRVSDGKTTDVLEKRFGVRTLDFSAERGFLLNGKPTLLRGGCIHHDNGLLGAAAYDAAENRKLSLLKAQGYNAVRCSHNLPSEHFLDACDSLGLMVIDETFDQWLRKKNEDDYHNYFAEFSDHDLQVMLRRDRNHPSIIMWSIGNEIPGRIEEAGMAAAARMRETVRQFDTTRPITAAICGWDEGAAWNSAARNWDEQDAKAFQSLDVGGYNYLYDKYEHDHATHPDRVICGLESYPKHASQNWDLVEQKPYVIGDFVWTAMDYLGEAGIGSASIRTSGNQSMFQSWPWYNGWCGDIDLIGQKKPQSYYRDVIWRRAPITMAVEEYVPDGSRMAVSAWGWQLEHQQWDAANGKLIMENGQCKVNVYSRSPQVRLYLNDKLIGTKATSNTYWAGFSVPYHPGTLRAVEFDGTNEGASFTLTTPGKPAALRLTADRKEILSNGCDLAYVTIELVDAEGRVISDSERQVNISVSGNGTLLAAGNASPTDMASFRSTTPKLFEGRALAIIKSTDLTGTISITVTTDGLSPQTITITSKH